MAYSIVITALCWYSLDLQLPYAVSSQVNRVGPEVRSVLSAGAQPVTTDEVWARAGGVAVLGVAVVVPLTEVSVGQLVFAETAGEVLPANQRHHPPGSNRVSRLA